MTIPTEIESEDVLLLAKRIKPLTAYACPTGRYALLFQQREDSDFTTKRILRTLQAGDGIDNTVDAHFFVFEYNAP